MISQQRSHIWKCLGHLRQSTVTLGTAASVSFKATGQIITPSCSMAFRLLFRQRGLSITFTVVSITTALAPHIREPLWECCQLLSVSLLIMPPKPRKISTAWVWEYAELWWDLPEPAMTLYFSITKSSEFKKKKKSNMCYLVISVSQESGNRFVGHLAQDLLGGYSQTVACSYSFLTTSLERADYFWIRSPGC